jgi:hypothetical protein
MRIPLRLCSTWQSTSPIFTSTVASAILPFIFPLDALCALVSKQWAVAVDGKDGIQACRGYEIVSFHRYCMKVT